MGGPAPLRGRPYLRRVCPRSGPGGNGAGVGGLLGGGGNPFRVKDADKTLQVGYGGRSKLVLSDGTTVWLNAGSRLIYPDLFTGDRRDVTLEGEAFFDVAKHVSMPFFVH